MRDSLGNDLGRALYSVGQRVELHPATDAWMRGDRYGQITKVGRSCYHVAMDISRRVLRIRQANILRTV